MLIFLILGGTFCLTGVIFLAVGLWMLYERFYKLTRCTEEIEAWTADFILSKWKNAPTHRLPGHSRLYTSRWFPVYEYWVEGQRFVQRSKVCFLSDQKPQASMVPIRYNPQKPERYYGPGEITLFGWVEMGLFLWVGGLFAVSGTLFLCLSLTAH